MSDQIPMGRDDGHEMDYSQITGNIFIGSDLCTGNVCPIHGPQFKKLGITVELNLSSEKKEIPPDHMDSYSWLPVVDGYAPNICQLAIGTSIINEAVASGNKVYIHCKNGHGRSPTMLAAYLLRYQNYSLDDAIKFIQSKRPEIHIEEKQIASLKEFSRKWSK